MGESQQGAALLVGAELGAGQQIFPYVHLRADPGGRMKGVEIAYLTTDDLKVGVAFMDATIAFHRGKC